MVIVFLIRMFRVSLSSLYENKYIFIGNSNSELFVQLR